MKRALFIFGWLVAEISAAPLPPVVPIVTAEQLQIAVAEAPVSKIDWVLPEDADTASDALSQRFFNQPAQRRYEGLTIERWREKWDHFASSLVSKAGALHLDEESLKQSLQRLNYGRNLQTALYPAMPNEVDFFNPTEKDKKAAADRLKAERAIYEERLKEREKNPETYFNDHLAVVPVGAYLARHAHGECWIVVCVWDYTSDQQPGKDELTTISHVMVWAIDTKTGAVLAYATCD